MVYEGEGWVAVGFSDDELMPGSDAVIGLPDEETALEYDMPEYSTPQEAEEQVSHVCVFVYLCKYY